MITLVHSSFRSRVRVLQAGVAAMIVLGLIAVPSADAATKKRTAKRPVAPKVIPLPPTTAPAPQPLPPTTAAVTTAPPTTVAQPGLTISSDVPRRLAVPGGSATYLLTAKSRSTEPTTLSVSGLPAGVRAVLATNPTTSTTTMTLTTTAGITPGGYQSFLVTAIGGGTSATLALELVVDTTAPAVTTTTVAPGAPQSFAPTAEVLLAGPILPGGATFVAYRVNLNRLPGFSGTAIVSAGSVPTGLAVGLSQTSVAGLSFDVSFSASASAVSGFYQPTVSVVLSGYTVSIAFPVQVNVVV